MVTNLARALAQLKERNIWIVGADERADKTLYDADLTGIDRLGAGRRRRGHAPPDARVLRPPGAHPDARRGRQPQRVGVGGYLSVRISASSSLSSVISRSLRATTVALSTRAAR